MLTRFPLKLIFFVFNILQLKLVYPNHLVEINGSKIIIIICFCIQPKSDVCDISFSAPLIFTRLRNFQIGKCSFSHYRNSTFLVHCIVLQTNLRCINIKHNVLIKFNTSVTTRFINHPKLKRTISLLNRFFREDNTLITISERQKWF